MEHAAAEAAGWGAPLLIGEYGIDPGAANADAWITAELDLQDAVCARHSAFWLWEELSGGYWGLFDGDSSDRAANDWRARRRCPDLRARSRDGCSSTPFDAAANTLRLRYHANSAIAAEIFAPHAGIPRGVALRCDGRPLQPRRAGMIVVHCGARARKHVLELAPRG